MPDKTDFDLDAYLAQSAALFDLPIEPELIPNVKLHLGLVLGHARAVMDFPLPDEYEPAAVYGA